MNDLLALANDLMRRALMLPEQATTLAIRIDRLHYFVAICTFAASAVLAAATIWFAYRYREKKRNASTPQVHPSMKFEAAVVGVPLVLFLLWGVIGFADYVWYVTPPSNTTDVYVTGKKWMWHFAYPDGPNANASLTVPANRPVRLLITSRDVIHSFYVPEFRVKQDAVPGRYTEIWFEATRPGKYRIYCTEYCGTWHSNMTGHVTVLPPAEFDRWIARERQGLAGRVDSSGGDPGGDPRGDLLSYGRKVAAVQGCLKCHTVDGDPHIGPTWVDLYRRPTLLESGETIVADEGYLTESMMDPYRKMVKGYAKVMPSFRGKLSAPDAAALVEYIKSLRRESLVNLPAKEPVYGPVQPR